jgi:hypothetical protein
MLAGPSAGGGLQLGDLVAATAKKHKDEEVENKEPKFNFEVHGKQLLVSTLSPSFALACACRETACPPPICVGGPTRRFGARWQAVPGVSGIYMLVHCLERGFMP